VPRGAAGRRRHHRGGGAGHSYGAPTPLEVEMAEAITAAYPSSSSCGRELGDRGRAERHPRRARRDRAPAAAEVDGCYHGHSDSLLVKAGSGGATFSIPDKRRRAARWRSSR